jgi:hypothetical protein
MSTNKRGREFFDLIIPQSVWIDFINRVNYQKIRVMEINFPEHIGVKKVDKLFSYLKTAKDYYIKGDYNKSIEECRRVIEDVPKLHKLPRNLSSAYFSQKINFFISDFLIKKVDSRITDHLKSTTIQLWRFSSQFHHNPNQPTIIPIVAKRSDAEYIINQTIDLAVYLSKII